MDIAPGLVSPAALAASVDSLLDSPPKLLPEDATAPALILPGARKTVSDWITGMLGSPFQPTAQDVVAVSKARHGVRPVALWDLPTRAIYRALTDELSPALPPLTRNSAAWNDFQREPLNHASKYIVAADIASCYQFIDHGLLADELTAQTGDGPRIKAIMNLLRSTSGQSYGIPQQSAASDLLAEAFLDRLERAIVRKGFEVFRYNDDFRICCDSWSEVVRSIEVLSEEARRHGLALNDSKVVTWSAKKYKDYMDTTDALRGEIAEEAKLDLTQYDADYEGEVTFSAPEDDDVDFLTSVLVLERWQKVAGRGRVAESKRAEHRALLQLLPFALSALSNSKDDAEGAVRIAMQLLRFEQTITPNVCNYLLTRQDDAEILQEFDRLLRQKVYLTNWQTWWLMGPVARLSGFTSGHGAKARNSWLNDAFQKADRLPILRARAGMALARHGQLQADEALRTFDRANDVVRPTIVAGIAFLKPPANIKRAVTHDNPLHKLVYAWAEKNA